jgi:hypothetical protein
MRDSKEPETPRISFTSEEWVAFIAGVFREIQSPTTLFRAQRLPERAAPASCWLDKNAEAP